MAKAPAAAQQHVEITPPNLVTAKFVIEGTAPMVQHKFGKKAAEEMRKTQEAGQKAKSKKKRPPKDFKKLFEEAQHVSSDGWNGIPCSAFRNAMISACRLAGVVMTRAKLAVHVEPDGFDAHDLEPLVKITKGKPKMDVRHVRLATGVIDLASRPMWAPGWGATVRVTFDADMFEAQDVANLLARAGLQVGIGEGRPDSKKSCGVGWGLFKIINE